MKMKKMYLLCLSLSLFAAAQSNAMDLDKTDEEESGGKNTSSNSSAFGKAGSKEEERKDGETSSTEGSPLVPEDFSTEENGVDRPGAISPFSTFERKSGSEEESKEKESESGSEVNLSTKKPMDWSIIETLKRPSMVSKMRLNVSPKCDVYCSRQSTFKHNFIQTIRNEIINFIPKLEKENTKLVHSILLNILNFWSNGYGAEVTQDGRVIPKGQLHATLCPIRGNPCKSSVGENCTTVYEDTAQYMANVLRNDNIEWSTKTYAHIDFGARKISMQYVCQSEGKKYHINALMVPYTIILNDKNEKVCDSSVIFNFFRELGRAQFEQTEVKCEKLRPKA